MFSPCPEQILFLEQVGGDAKENLALGKESLAIFSDRQWGERENGLHAHSACEANRAAQGPGNVILGYSCADERTATELRSLKGTQKGTETTQCSISRPSELSSCIGKHPFPQCHIPVLQLSWRTNVPGLYCSLTARSYQGLMSPCQQGVHRILQWGAVRETPSR